ncbi:serine hydrolase [Leucobacter coleopterorum]|uniref:serine hydrolase n=1 Tax=Leucobacter coleopterorum TaxID=2714933 RepID=UPI003CC77957
MSNLWLPGVQVAGKTGSWGPFRHDSAVVTHSGEPPVAVSILTRSMDFDRVIPAIDDGIGEMAAMLVDCVRAQTW